MKCQRAMLRERGKEEKKVLIICIIIIAALIGVVIYLLVNKDGKEKRNVVVNEDNLEEIIAQMGESDFVAPGSYEMTMNSTWNFKDGSAASEDAYVENAVSNTNSVYFDVIRNDTEETIFESPILPVGSHLEGITLDTKLEAGTYDCVLIYHLLDENDESISTVRVSVTIIVEN